MLAATLCLAAAAKTSNEVIRDIRADGKAFTVRLNRSKRKFLECVAQLDTCVYLPLARVCDEDGTVQLFGRMKNGSIRELLVAVADGDDCTLVRLKGKLTQEDVQRMVGNKN